MDIIDVAVIGAGPAGFHLARMCRRAGRSVALFEKSVLGGQVATAGDFGPTGSATEPPAWSVARSEQMEWLDESLGDLHAEGPELYLSEVEFLARENDVWTVRSADHTVAARIVVLALGRDEDDSIVPSARRYLGHGVSTCPSCDAPLFRGKRVVVVGSDNVAACEAVAVAKFAQSVRLLLLAHNTVDQQLITAANGVDNLEVVHGVESIGPVCGTQVVAGVNVSTASAKYFYDTDGLFISERKPNTTWLAGVVQLNAGGFISAGPSLECGPGLLAIGEVREEGPRDFSGALADAERAAQAIGSSH